MEAAATYLVPQTGSCSTDRGQTRSWQDLLGTGLGTSMMQSFRGNERGSFLPSEYPLLQPCQHSKLCSYDAHSNEVNRPKPEIAQGTAPSQFPLYLSVITNFQLGCQRIPDDRHVMFTKGNLKRNLSAMKVRGSPSPLLASRLAIEMSDFF